MKKLTLAVAIFSMAVGCEKPAPNPTAPTPGITTNPATDRAEGAQLSVYMDSVALGVKFLLNAQNEDGGWGSYMGKPMSNLGVSSLVVYTIFKTPVTLDGAAKAVLEKGEAYIVRHQKESGSFSDPQIGLDNYTTSASVMALAASGKDEYLPALELAKRYLLNIQLDESENVNPDNPNYGGAPYSAGRKFSDGSNTGMWLDAMKELGAKEDDPGIQKALVFMKRLQNNPETNDQPWAKAVEEAPENFGGGVYRPAENEDRTKDGKEIDISKAGRIDKIGWRSYGSMTYAMFKGFIYAGLKKDDPSVAAALKWIEANYSMDENPGMGATGQYYYYRLMGRALGAWGEDTVGTHAWASELADKLVTLQREDGSWLNTKSRWMETIPSLVTAYSLEAMTAAIKQLEK